MKASVGSDVPLGISVEIGAYSGVWTHNRRQPAQRRPCLSYGLYRRGRLAQDKPLGAWCRLLHFAGHSLGGRGPDVDVVHRPNIDYCRASSAPRYITEQSIGCRIRGRRGIRNTASNARRCSVSRGAERCIHVSAPFSLHGRHRRRLPIMLHVDATYPTGTTNQSSLPGTTPGRSRCSKQPRGSCLHNP